MGIGWIYENKYDTVVMHMFLKFYQSIHQDLLPYLHSL